MSQNSRTCKKCGREFSTHAVIGGFYARTYCPACRVPFEEMDVKPEEEDYLGEIDSWYEKEEHE